MHHAMGSVPGSGEWSEEDMCTRQALALPVFSQNSCNCCSPKLLVLETGLRANRCTNDPDPQSAHLPRPEPRSRTRVWP